MSFRPFSAFRGFGGGAFRRSYLEEVLLDSPVAYWRLGEASGTTAADVMGSYAGTYVGSPTLGVAGAVGGNTAATFNGSSQYVRAANGSSLAFANATFTVECWFKASTPAATQIIVAKDYTATGWTVALNSAGKIVVATKGPGNIDSAIRSTTATTFGNNAWRHVMAVIQTNTSSAAGNDILAVYVDGISQALSANTGTVVYSAPTLEVEIGRRSTGLYLAGSVDEVAIYSGDKSARALAHYQAA